MVTDMKKNYINQTKKKNDTALTLGILFVCLSALYCLRLLSSTDTMAGYCFVKATNVYPLLLLGEYVCTFLVFLPLFVKKDIDKTLSVFLSPVLMLVTLGVMRLDSDVMISDSEADFIPSVSFLCFAAVLISAAFSKLPFVTNVGNIVLCILFPSFSLTLSPCLTAAGFLFDEEKPLFKKISAAVNLLTTAAFAVIYIVNAEKYEFSFGKKHVLVLLFSLCCIAYFAFKKNYSLCALGLLPLLALTAGIFFRAFPTENFTLSVCVAGVTLTAGLAAISGKNQKLKEYALTLVHTPSVYIILSAFLLHVSFCLFTVPGMLRSTFK